MLNRNSAIIEKYNIGKYPFEDNIEIIFSENCNLIIQQIAAWPDEISNIEKFSADRVADRILDMGDIVGIVEKAEKEFDDDCLVLSYTFQCGSMTVIK